MSILFHANRLKLNRISIIWNVFTIVLLEITFGIEFLRQDVGSLNPSLIDTLYKEGIKQVKLKARICFEKQAHLSWTMSTWSGKMQQSYIQRLWNDIDKAALHSPSCNQGKNIKTCYKRKRKQQKLLFTPPCACDFTLIAKGSNGEEGAWLIHILYYIIAYLSF